MHAEQRDFEGESCDALCTTRPSPFVAALLFVLHESAQDEK
jgi:hypothetical protein